MRICSRPRIVNFYNGVILGLFECPQQQDAWVPDSSSHLREVKLCQISRQLIVFKTPDRFQTTRNTPTGCFGPFRVSIDDLALHSQRLEAAG